MDSKNSAERESNCDRSRYTKINTTLAPGNGPIRINVIKRSYCFVFCIFFIIDNKTHLLCYYE